MLSTPFVAAAELAAIDVVGRLLLAALLGGLLGVERELDGQDAGFRTHLLLALGAGLFGAISVGGFSSLVADPAETNVQIDVTRVASYVAAGIGFIGGGAILKHRGSITGITTAASLWTAAAVGLAAGLGFWVGAVTTGVIAVVALRGLQPLSNWLARHGQASVHQDRGGPVDRDDDRHVDRHGDGDDDSDDDIDDA